MSDLAREITPVNIEEELKSSYLDYAMSVIVGRALPDVRDGLKPVHRRVLYAMNVLGNDWNKAYKKSARVVGDVIGKYHPHGDIAVYDTIVRMAQPFSLRYMLVDGQGNFGSVDGDSAAAMRYTEIRMSKIAHELMADLEKETVDFVDNYDGTEQIPDVMPTKIPNLLVNGSSGIAVGMATNIPPHKALPENTASAEDRCEMVRRLTADMPWAHLDTIEIDRGGASYTVDTLRALHARGETDLHLIVGTDMLLSFDRIWRAPDEIARLASLAVCARENEDWDALREKAAALKDSLGATVELVQGDSLTISSTELRQGGALRCYTPESVADYIEEKHLYGY